MKLKVTVLSENHKNILRAQRQHVMSTLDAIAGYLFENGDVDAEWRMMLNNEHRINYYDVIPDKGRLRCHEIDIELLVTNQNREFEIKEFKKDVRKANEALISIVNSTLKDRKAKLLDMLKDATGESRDLINAHITQTENLMKECFYLKFCSQLILAEVGGLHFIADVLKQVRENIRSYTHVNYIQFKKYMNKLKEIVQLYSPVREQGDYVLRYSSRDILVQRQEFNKNFNLCKSLLVSFLQEELVDYDKEQMIIKSLDDLQHLFFAKCDVNLLVLDKVNSM